jgi:hypothetical protein
MKLSSPQHKFFVTLVLAFFILTAFLISGFTVAHFDQNLNQAPPPNQGPGTDVIRNGGFEERDTNANNGVALEWEPYSNGQAWFGWYDETWPEAVRRGAHAQLMEIFQVEANILDRVIAIHQTVNVIPNSTYSLTLYAIMRTQAPPDARNNFEFEMHWGVDPSGTGNYQNVQTWNRMDLTEQFRLGSNGEFPDDEPLFYETVTGTVQTGNSNRITLFIRGLKKFPTGTEVNFDVDDVSLVGPISTTAPAPQPLVPTTGYLTSKNVSVGAIALGGLVLITLGVGAVTALVKRKEKF